MNFSPLIKPESPSPKCAQPRQGQALILAVFVMLLAALLGSTFLVLVASTSQSVTQGNNKSEAEISADDAVKRVKDSIAASPDPDNWSPEANPTAFDLRDARDFPPASDEPFYEQYWTPLDRAMGWALPDTFSYGTLPTDSDPNVQRQLQIEHKIQKLQEFKATGGRVFVKVPNPITTKNLTTRPFMVESRLLWKGADELSDGGDKKWMLAATIIGLTARDGNSWSRRTLYKPTNYNGGTLAHANFVSNYDWNYDGTRQNFATAPLANIALVSGEIYDVAINDEDFRVFQPGQTLMVSSPDYPPASGIIRERKIISGQLVLTTRFLTPPSPFNPTNSTVSLAGTLMTDVDQVDTTGDNSALFTAPASTTNAANDNVAANTDTAHFGNGYFFNLGMVARQNPTFGLRPPHVNSALRTASGQNFLVSTGPVDTGSPTAPANATNAPQTVTIRNILTNNTQTVPALPSGENTYMRVGFGANGGLQTERLVAKVDPVEPPRPLRPAKIDLSRYEALAKGTTAAGAHGYGPGVFIDNAEDFDKTSAGEMTNSQLHRWWQRKSFESQGLGSVQNVTYTGNNAALTTGSERLRLSFPRPGVDNYTYPLASGSLEEKGIRGWISPWEFVPRGATITLRGNDYIQIDREHLDNNGNTDLAKSWKDSAGVVIPAQNHFSMFFNPNLPLRTLGLNGAAYADSQTMISMTSLFNGVIYAQGNIKIRGNWTGRPLTIVSGQNIYVEGSLGNVSSKIALLAKRNVVANPTAFFGRYQGVVDRSSLPTNGEISGNLTNVGAQVTVSNTDANRLKLGDFVQIRQGNLATTKLLRIREFNRLFSASVTRLLFEPTLSSAKPNGFANGACQVIPVTDPPVTAIDAAGKSVASNSPNAVSWAYTFNKAGHTLMRTIRERENVNSGNEDFIYSLKHSAQRVNVKIKANNVSQTTSNSTGANFTLKIKEDKNTNSVVDPIGAGGFATYEKLFEANVTGGTQPSQTPPRRTVTYLLNDVREESGAPISTPVAGQGGDTTATLGELKTLLEETGNEPGPPPEVLQPWWSVIFPTQRPDGTAIPDPTTSANPYKNLPARFFAQYLSTATNGPDTEFEVPLTTSVGRFWRGGNAQTDSANWTADGTMTQWRQIGSSIGPVKAWDGTNNRFVNDLAEDVDTIRPEFYGAAPVWTGAFSENPNANEQVGAFVMTRALGSDTDSLLPQYNLASWHIEGLPDGNNLRPVYNCTVNATIYAQEGSWFVIPMPAFAAPGETNASRNRRQHFSLVVNGNMAQCFTPTADLDYDSEPDPDGLAWGAMRRWMDGMARPTQLVAGAPSSWRLPDQNAKAIERQLDTEPVPGQPPLKLYLPSSGEVLYMSNS